jgi:hypothetical protein
MTTDFETGMIERELELVRSAIAMVAAGRSPRVTLAGLTFGTQLLDVADGMARNANVRLVPLWSGDESGADIVVERPTDG